MPITPSALRLRRKSLSFTYGDDTVNLEYYPSAVGADMVPTLNKLMERANTASDDAEADAALRDIGAWLCSLIAWWDYLEEDGETMQPLTPENLGQQIVTFTDFMQAVVLAIVTDRNQGNANGTPSSASSAGTSSPTAASASMAASRNPSASSSSRAGSKARRASNGSLSTPSGTSGPTSVR